ncbi:MAG: HAD family hydrolase [Caldilineaceae bacterium]|nr:HAD family hydrolase [Caldilineaceae bacterium]
MMNSGKSQDKPTHADPADQGTPPDSDELRPGMEPLTAEEKEAFLARARAAGRSLTSEEQYAIFGPPPEPAPAPKPQFQVTEMQPAHLDQAALAQLQDNFFPELGDNERLPGFSLLRGIIFDFDYTLAELTQPHAELLEAGAKAAADYMRSTGMELPDDFWNNIIEARRFSEEKSEEEQEEHIADDAMSFLLQFFGYPASQMDPQVLQRAVDIFYAPEMTAWRLRPGVKSLLQSLHAQGYKLAVISNYNADRVFQRTIDYLGIRPYLDICLSSASVEYRKPDTKIFDIALERWDALAYEVVIVGDSLAQDIAGGIELGSLTVLVEQPTTPQVAFSNEQLANQVKPDARVTDLAELPHLLHQWATP